MHIFTPQVSFSDKVPHNDKKTVLLLHVSEFSLYVPDWLPIGSRDPWLTIRTLLDDLSHKQIHIADVLGGRLLLLLRAHCNLEHFRKRRD